MCKRAVEGGSELRGRLDGFGPAAIGAGEGGEVGVGERGAAKARGIFAFLMHANRAVAAIVD